MNLAEIPPEPFISFAKTRQQQLSGSVDNNISATSHCKNSGKPPSTMANNDLQKWITSDVDFYELLGLPLSTFSSSELRRAYRKTSLKYHPDKLGKDFDPEKYDLFQSAYAILDDEELKAKYDNHRAAKLQKQRANELFEGKRRTMKEELEARERGGVKRAREEEEGETEMQAEMKRLAEEGRRRRAERSAAMGSSRPEPTTAKESKAASSPLQTNSQTTEPKQKQSSPPEEEDEIAILERKIREAGEAKVKRKAEKKARKSGIFVPLDPDSPVVGGAGEKAAGSGSKVADRNLATPIKRPDIFRGLKADDKSSASPKFSFSPSIPTPKRKDFTATMDRLKAAEKSRLEEEIRREEAESAI